MDILWKTSWKTGKSKEGPVENPGEKEENCLISSSGLRKSAFVFPSYNGYIHFPLHKNIEKKIGIKADSLGRKMVLFYR